MTAVAAWSDHEAEAGSCRWAYRELGAGEPVLALDPPGDDTALASLVEAGAGRRLIALGLPSWGDDPRALAADVARLATQLDLGSCGVVARGAAAAVALWLAHDAPGAVSVLVLESPALAGRPKATGRVGTDAAGAASEVTGSARVEASLLNALPAIDVPTLVLLGQRTDSAAPGHTGVYKRMPGSTVGIVYDAGGDVRADRPEAYVAAVRDYLERGQAFVVNVESGVIRR